MHKKYDFRDIEKKWQDIWSQSSLYATSDTSTKEKLYVLDMFPYPSGEGLHVGHPKGYIATDVYSRMKKMQGYEVLHPMGWDAFGLPAENYAIKHKVHPRVAVEKNIENFKAQLAHLGFNYDWSREINTTDPEYYKWTQWIFLKLLEKGLAYESYEPINWCPSCQTGLANEDLESDGTCERCGSVVEKKPMRQWVLRITDYADRMLEDLNTLTKWPEHIKEAQRNWIGKSEGAEFDFKLSTGDSVKIFTTRPDTLFGATYLVLAPEHPLVSSLLAQSTHADEIIDYVKKASEKSEIERTKIEKDKTGVELKGIAAKNPATGEDIPVFIADYVLAHYGTGAIMAVPAHDERDFAFAKNFGLPIRQVIAKHFLAREQIARNRRDVYALITQDGKYLIQHFKSRDHYWLPGGGLESSENEVECLAREIREETGYIDFSIQSKVFVGLLDAETREKTFLRNETNVFSVSLNSVERTGLSLTEKELTDDIENLWLTKTEIQSLSSEFEPERIALILEAVTAFETNSYINTDTGRLVASGDFSGMSSEEAKPAITEKFGGKITSTYKLNDWVFSRQRYWGEPIPVIHCTDCGVVPVPYEELPVTLPEVEHYEPTGTGESPLANIESWVNVSCPKCGKSAKRETNTMPQWAGSSWYYLRFIDPKNETALIDPDKEKKWAPVDVYVGGDHAVRHLIYARFWHKFLYDIGVVHTVEPFTRLEFLGFILAEDGRKMSKRWGNIINPDDVVTQNGADTLRVYEMFMGPFENTIAWSTDGLVGAQRFLERVAGLHSHIQDSATALMTSLIHKTIAKVGDDISHFKFNTAISQLMICINGAEKEGITRTDYEHFLKLLAPFAPHLIEELWHNLGNTSSIHEELWPSYDEALTRDAEVVLGVQINGKMRGTLSVPRDAEEETVLSLLKESTELGPKITGEIQRVIYVKNKIVNLIL